MVAYVLMQFAWWAFYLVQLRMDIKTLELTMATDVEQRHHILTTFNSKMLMIAGEGLVFLCILTAGIWSVFRGLKKEESVIRMRNNFLLSVSHELKTPISVVKLFQQTFIKRSAEAEKLVPLASAALAETNRLEALVEKMLFAAALEDRTENRPDTLVSVSDLIKSIQSDYSDRPEFGLLVVEDINEINILGNEAYLKFALANLLENAFKYAPGTKVLMTAKEHPDKVVISVSDDGPGISPEEEQKIFNKFYRSGNEMVRKTKGTGLGLYLVKVIADMHNARVSVINNPSKGATFAITFKKVE